MSKHSSHSKFMIGSPVLIGDSTIPGVTMSDELRNLLPKIYQAVTNFGCDYYPTVVEMLTYDEISEIAAYGGFPVRFPHWQWGMEYEELQRGYEHGMHRIYEMVVNCLSPETKVLTERGTISAASVRFGDKVFLGSSYRNVVAVKKQPRSATFCVKLKDYAHDLISTGNHKWRVMAEEGLIWKETKDINVGDLIVGSDNYTSHLNHPCKFDWTTEDVWDETRPNIRHCLKEINPPKQMTLALAELLGVLVGDGSTGVTGCENSVYVTQGLDPNLNEYVNHIQQIFSEVFEADTLIQEKNGGRIVLLCSKYAVDFLDHIGLTKGITYKNKRIPYSIWNSSQEYRAAFLRGIFDTDGYAGDVLGFSGHNYDLVADVQLMLAEMGIVSRIDTRYNGVGLDGSPKTINVLEIHGKPSLERFRDRIGFKLAYKADGLNLLIDTQYCRGGGHIVKYIQNMLITWSKQQGITTYNNPSLGRSIKNMEREPVGLNCLYSFAERAIDSAAYNFDNQILSLLRTPYFVVESIEDAGTRETVDIALDHDDHDFIANGMITHNTNPCYIYCLDSNTLVDNVTVVAHALGHCDFFKNNVFFSKTSQNMMNQLANHGTRIRRYIARWGKETVTEFLDHVIRIQTLVDPANAWKKKTIKDPVVKDERHYRQPGRLHVAEGHDYMEDYLNPKQWTEKQKKKIEKQEAADYLNLFVKPTKDIMRFIRDNAPLKPWQVDIVAMLYDEAMYFAPQRCTKMLNEGWASMVDYKLIACEGMSALGQETDGAGIIEYAVHKMGVLGGKYSMNPYKLGFNLLCDIEERWNKGQFGDEWDECPLEQRKDWDKKLGLGHEKIFEVRKFYNDATALIEYFTPEFCEKYEFFEWKKYKNGEYKIENKDPVTIKKKLVSKYLNGGLPEINLVDPNHKNKGHMLLEHSWDGRQLYEAYLDPVMKSLRFLWGKDIFLTSKNKDKTEIIYSCEGDEGKFYSQTREDYESDEEE